MSSMSCIKLLIIFVICTGHVTWAQTNFRLCVPNEMSAQCEILHRGDSEVTCVLVADTTDCALKMKRGEIDFGLFETEQAMVAVNHLQGEDFMVVGEVRQQDNQYEEFAFTSVVVARRSSVPSGELWRHKDLKLCHPGMGRTSSGWSDRVLKSLDKKMIDTIKDASQCDEWRSTLENEINSINKVWGPSCRPGIWSMDEETDARLKQDHESLCALCPDTTACSYGSLESDPHKGAAQCLQKGGDVAFMEQMYAKLFIQSMNMTPNTGEWTLVCRDLSFGNNASTCNWDRQPWPPVVARREISTKLSAKLNEWLKTTYPRSKRDLTETIPTPQNDSDSAVRIPPEQPRENAASVPPQPRDESEPTPTPRRTGEAAWITALRTILLDTYEVYEVAKPLVNLRTSLGRGRDVSITLEEETAKSCRGALRWCSTQMEERSKCEWLSYAAMVAGVVPPIKCLGAESGLACARFVHEHKSDLVVTNIDEAHRAQSELKMEVIKFMESSRINYHRSVVVVVNANSNMRNISEMEGKKTCFPVMEGIAFGAFLRESMATNSLPSSCPYGVAVGEYLGESCVPGANKIEENPEGLCALCEAGVVVGGANPGSWNKPPNKCAAHEGNVHFGDEGALKCLQSGGGDVAWVELQGAREAIQKQLISKMKEEDFKVLCTSGQSISLNLGESCSLSTVPSGAAIMRYKDTLESYRDIHNALTQIDRLFGLQVSKHPPPSFHMYRAFNGTRGLIFPEGTVGMLDKTSKIPSVEAYIGLTVLVPRPCGEGDYNAAMTTSVSIKLFIAILALKTFLL